MLFLVPRHPVTAVQCTGAATRHFPICRQLSDISVTRTQIGTKYMSGVRCKVLDTCDRCRKSWQIRFLYPVDSSVNGVVMASSSCLELQRITSSMPACKVRDVYVAGRPTWALGLYGVTRLGRERRWLK